MREKFKLTKEKSDETKAEAAIQDAADKELKAKIQVTEADVKARLSVVEEARRVNAYEKDKNIKFAKANAALKAKLEFIEEKYDYSSAAKQMSVNDFKELMMTNSSVNTTM